MSDAFHGLVVDSPKIIDSPNFVKNQEQLQMLSKTHGPKNFTEQKSENPCLDRIEYSHH